MSGPPDPTAQGTLVTHLPETDEYQRKWELDWPWRVEFTPDNPRRHEEGEARWQWCKVNLAPWGTDVWTMTLGPWDQRIGLSSVVYYFKNAQHAAEFKLRWL